MKLSEDSLHQLTFSLLPKERLRFKKYYQNNKGNEAGLQLFNELKKQKTYDPRSIKQKLKRFELNFSETKKYLYNFIISFLITNQTEGDSIEERLDYLFKEIKILHKKGLLEESAKLLVEIKIMAEKYEFYNKLLDIIDFELKFIRAFYHQYYLRRIENSYKKRKNILYKIKQCDTYKEIYLCVNQVLEKNNSIVYKKYIQVIEEKIFLNKISDQDLKQFPFTSQYYYLLTLIWYHNINDDAKNSYLKNKQLFQLWKSFPYMIEKHKGVYLQYAALLAHHKIVFKDFSNVSEILSSIENYSTNMPIGTFVYSKHNLLMIKSIISVYSGKLSLGMAFAVKALTIQPHTINKNSAYIFIQQKCLTYYQLAILSFMTNDLMKCNYYLKKLDGFYSSFSKSNMDLVQVYKIMKMLLLFSKKDFTSLEFQYLANEKFFKRNKPSASGSFEKIFMSFFKAILKCNSSNEIEKFLKSFQSQLIETNQWIIIENKLMFSFTDWIESYLRATPIENILFEKAKTKYPEIFSITL